MTTLAEARHPALHTAGAHWTLSEGGAGVGIHSLTSPMAVPLTPGSIKSPSSQDLVKKVGSYQEYIHAECTMDDLSPSKISVDEVHKIAILDIRLMNADRNVANILCQRIPEDPDHFRLVPIDHGYSLRSKCDVAWFDWCWLDWPQTKQPLSKASKEYVLGLDIEADARLLRERLNMEDDVLDYFRSSCQILKAGVKAGLTLYDICSEILCRNDPSGEIPSKIETLTSMASELATSAVHNGRFHHATASLALEEQLATRRSLMDQRNQPSCKFPAPYKSRPFTRSASSSVFSQVPSLGGESAFTDDLSKMDSMVQSSQSDNSLDGDSFTSDSPEDSAAGEWAAALVAVADQSMDKESAALLFGRDRSISESSESSSGSDGSSSSSSSCALSKSPIGFWYVRPGSSSIDDVSQDSDEPICWTPSLQSSSHPIRESLLSDEDHILSPSGFSTSNLGKLLTESSGAGFASAALDESSHQSSNADDEFGPITPPADQAPPTVSCLSSFKPLKKTMCRSISYSAFSTYNTALRPNTDSKPNKLCHSTAMRTSLSSAQENDLFRTYFVKFVDLLVVRETERLVHSKEASTKA
ncbi:hypothetical protein ACHAXR_002731 [Thalassiosira sp. AJA248-18]